MRPMPVVVFASGRGSNARQIFQAAQENASLLSVEALICNVPDAPVCQIAKDYQVPLYSIPIVPKETPIATRLAHEKRIHEVLSHLSWSYICLAGYMRILTADFVERYPHPVWPVSRILNIHPSLLPDFTGLNAYRQAFEAGDPTSGVTIHFVSAEVDAGAVIHQQTFPRLPADTLASFEARGLVVEHQAYRAVLFALAQGQYQVDQDPFSIRLALTC